MVLNKILRQLSSELRLTELGQSELSKYRQMQKHDGYKVYQSFIVTIANEMTKYLLSKEFTEQDAVTKDREQWVLRMAKEMFDFLFDPLKASESAARIAAHNVRTEGTAKRDRPKKEG